MKILYRVLGTICRSVVMTMLITGLKLNTHPLGIPSQHSRNGIPAKVGTGQSLSGSQSEINGNPTRNNAGNRGINGVSGASPGKPKQKAYATSPFPKRKAMAAGSTAASAPPYFFYIT